MVFIAGFESGQLVLSATPYSSNQEKSIFSSLPFRPHRTSHGVKPQVTAELLSYRTTAFVSPRVFISFISCDWSL